MISEQNEQQALWDALDYFDSVKENLERSRIMDALFTHDNNRSRAAASLGIGRTLLLHKIKKYNLA